jgi:hypothetical protein
MVLLLSQVARTRNLAATTLLLVIWKRAPAERSSWCREQVTMSNPLCRGRQGLVNIVQTKLRSRSCSQRAVESNVDADDKSNLNVVAAEKVCSLCQNRLTFPKALRGESPPVSPRLFAGLCSERVGHPNCWPNVCYV